MTKVKTDPQTEELSLASMTTASRLSTFSSEMVSGVPEVPKIVSKVPEVWEGVGEVQVVQ